VSSLLQDLHKLPMAAQHGSDLASVLAARGVHVVELHGWSAIDAAEIELGRAHGRDRTTIHSREALLALTRDHLRPSD
jgi:ferredoxin--NADP+ reductase